jgi:hypothetical protein
MRVRIAAWLAVIMGWERGRLRPRDYAEGVETHLMMTPHVEFIRVYDQPGGYEKRLPYAGILAVTFLTDKVVYLHGAVGRVDRVVHAQAFDMLRTRGVSTVMVERHGRMKTIELAPVAAPEQHQYSRAA